MPAQAGIQDLLLLRVDANEIRSKPRYMRLAQTPPGAQAPGSAVARMKSGSQQDRAKRDRDRDRDRFALLCLCLPSLDSAEPVLSAVEGLHPGYFAAGSSEAAGSAQ